MNAKSHLLNLKPLICQYIREMERMSKQQIIWNQFCVGKKMHVPF